MHTRVPSDSLTACCTVEFPFSRPFACALVRIDGADIWYERVWLENLGVCEINQGRRLVDDGATACDGDIPVDASGGVLSGNPTGATGLFRFAEAALQVRGMAGEHQIDGVRRAVGHAMGGASQFHATWVVGAEKNN